MELGFACKSLASSLCVEARLLTQIFDTSSQLRLEECSTSCKLIGLWAGPSTAVVVENRMLYHFNSPLPASPRPPTHVCVCPYVCAVHSRLVQVQPEVRLAFTLSVGARNCVNGWYLETSPLGLLLPLPDFMILY
jgi:hypothetical protein